MLCVDRVDQTEVLDSLLGLVGLQVADEVPGDIAVEDIEFALSLLDAILTDIGGTGVNGLAHRFDIVVLRDSDELHRRVLRHARAARHGILDILFNLMEIFCNHETSPVCIGNWYKRKIK